MIIVLVHISLSIILFYIINWIGKHSYSLGYVQISLFVQNEEAPAFNFLIRVLAPIVYLIIVSAILYQYKQDQFVTNIYLINTYYLAFRLFFGLVTGRARLINWHKQLLYWIAILTISYETYDKLIRIKANILPDFTKVAEEVWIMILVFIFQVFNNIKVSNENEISRKENFLFHRYANFKSKFGTKIHNELLNEKLEAIAFAIIIYEDFNRPLIIRYFENISMFLTKKPHTLGIM